LNKSTEQDVDSPHHTSDAMQHP